MRSLLKSKLGLFLIAFVVLVGGFVVASIIKPVPEVEKNQAQNSPSPKEQAQEDNSKPRLISVTPDLEKNHVILPEQVIELTFNMPLENVGEFKVKIEPQDKAFFRIELSSDRKTAKIIPTKPYLPGQPYDLTIGPDTKFEGRILLDQSMGFSFRTVSYKGV